MPPKNTLMSRTSTAPCAASLRHNSVPFVEVLAVKNRTPLTLVRLAGLELPLPNTMSRATTVPAVVPSLFQSSVPVAVPGVLSVAVK